MELPLIESKHLIVITWKFAKYFILRKSNKKKRINKNE